MSNHVGNGTTNGTNGFFKLNEFTQIVRNLDRKPKFHVDILDVIGNTPMVKLNSIPQEEGVQCEMYAKCEYLNPGGSVKDRIAYRMFIEAERKGILIPGKSVIIEPTSGNTGIGLALAAAVRGYRCIIVLPEKMSDEKVNTLLALGAEIVRTPTEVPSESPESNIGVANKLLKEIPNAVVLDQYNNPCNPLAHYEGTAEEILWSLDDQVDMVVIGAGTGGTISGTAHKIKERCPNCIVVGVDPYGSILASPDSLNETDVSMYEVEGIGYDFFPKTLHPAVVDKWVKSDDYNSLNMAKRLIKQEGLLAGGSSGAAMYGAIKMAKTLKAGQKCVVLFPDSIRNYMTKFIKDQWMEARALKPIPQRDDLWWWKNPVNKLMLKSIHSVPLTSSVKEAYAKLKVNATQVLAVTDDNGSLAGLFTSDNVRNRLVNLSNTMDDDFNKFLVKKYYKVDLLKKPTLGDVSRMLDIASYVVVVQSDADTAVQTPVGLITCDELLTQISVDKY